MSKSDDVVGYVHRLSPIKKGKSAEYSEFEIQLKNEQMNGVCFSGSKRKLLEEAAVNMRPLKITHYIKGEFCGQPSIKVNNMTKICNATTHECDYQYQPSAASQKLSLKAVVDTIKPNQVVAEVVGKITTSGEVDIKGSSKLKMMNSVINDGTALVNLTLWEDDISKVESGKVYSVSNTRVRLFNGKKLLTSTKSSNFREIQDEGMEKLQESEAKRVLDETSDVKCVIVERVEEIESIDRFLKCKRVECQKKLQASVSGKSILCDSCHRRMRVSDCPKSISVRVAIMGEDHQTALSLTVFEAVLAKVIEAPADQDDEQLTDSVLDLSQLSIKYNSRDIIQEITIVGENSEGSEFGDFISAAELALITDITEDD